MTYASLGRSVDDKLGCEEVANVTEKEYLCKPMLQVQHPFFLI